LKKKGNIERFLLNCVDFKNPVTAPLIGTHDKPVHTTFWRRGNCVKVDGAARREKFGILFPYVLVHMEDLLVSSLSDHCRAFADFLPAVN